MKKIDKKSKNLLFINPYINDFAYYGLFSKPMGLLYIASFLEKNNYDIKFIDCLDMKFEKENTLGRDKKGQRILRKEYIQKPAPLKEVPRRYKRYGISVGSFKKLLGECKDISAVLVTSMMTYWYPGVFHTIKIIKEVLGDIPVILGGIYASLEHEHAKKFSGADFVVNNNDINAALKLVDNICGGAYEEYVDTDEFDGRPYPSFHLYKGVDYVPVLTSRGCPFDCSYCAGNKLTPFYKMRDFKNTIREIIHWTEKYKVKNFVVYDDAFLYKAEKNAVPLLKEIVKKRLNLKFHLPNAMHAKYMTKEIASLLRLSGFTTIRLGLETANEKIMEKTGAKVTNEEFLNSVEHLRSAGFTKDEIGVYILAGIVGQKYEDVLRAIGFVKEAGARPIIAEYSPIRGSKMFEDAAKESIVDIKTEPLYQNNTLVFLRSKEFSFEKIEHLKRLSRS